MNDKQQSQARNWREVRRFRAWELSQRGWKQSTIAEALGVSEGAVSQWLKKAREEGIEGLQQHKGGGPKPRLSEEQIAGLPQLLEQGAARYGFRGDVWTRPRVAAVIKQVLGVEFSLTHIGRLLRQIGWSRQKPITRASQRNEEAIAQWRSEKWHELQKKRGMRDAP